MEHLIGGISQLGWVAAKALLLYLTAVVGFRLCKRRTLADLSPFDFVAVVAVGAIIGRVPNATDASYLAGVATLVTVLAAHAVITRLRQFPSIARLIEHSPRVLVSDGHVLEQELRRCGLTRGDLNALLRQEGVQELSEVKYLIFEQRGRVSSRRSMPLLRPEHQGHRFGRRLQDILLRGLSFVPSRNRTAPSRYGGAPW
jgi:uncharacterized membrane protein YcaP (DUF421 family)